GRGVYDQYFTGNTRDPGSEKPSKEVTLIEGEDQSGSRSGSKDSGSQSGSKSSKTGGSSVSQSTGSGSGSGSSSGVSKSGNGSRKTENSNTDKKGNNSSDNTDQNKSDQDTNTDDEEQVKPGTTVMSLKNNSDGLAKVRVISKEGPDVDGFYTFKAEIISVVYGEISAKEMTVFYDGENAPSLDPGDEAYFFLVQISSDEFYITEEKNGVVEVTDGKVIFTSGVSVDGKNKEGKTSMSEAEFLKYVG
ncbi:MAG: hypothetical protein ACI4LM_00665, partial [Anaerovoracaceae bacterium]